MDTLRSCQKSFKHDLLSRWLTRSWRKDQAAVIRINGSATVWQKRVTLVMQTGQRGCQWIGLDCSPGYRSTTAWPIIVVLLVGGQEHPGRRYQPNVGVRRNGNMSMNFPVGTLLITYTLKKTWRCLDACLEEDPGDGGVVRAALNDIADARNMTQL